MDQTPMPQTPMNSQQNYAQQPPAQISWTPQQPKKSGLAIAGLVLGILALISSWMPIVNNLSFILAAIGAILAIVGLIGALRGKNSSKGLAIAGVVLNVVAIIVVFATQSLYSAAIDEALSDSPTSAAPAATSVSEEATSEPEEEETQADSPAEPAEEVDYAHMAIGDAVSFDDGTTVVVNEVETGLADYSGDPATRVNVTIRNDGDDTLSFGSYGWNAEDANGVQRSMAIMFDSKDELDFSASLAAGGTVSGNIYLEGDAVRVLYQNNIFLDDSQVGWDVQ